MYDVHRTRTFYSFISPNEKFQPIYTQFIFSHLMSPAFVRWARANAEKPNKNATYQ